MGKFGSVTLWLLILKGEEMDWFILSEKCYNIIIIIGTIGAIELFIILNIIIIGVLIGVISINFEEDEED